MKTKRRIYVENTPLNAGADITLDAPQANYLLNVLRLGAGDEVHLFNAENGEWRGEIGDGRKSKLYVKLVSQTRPSLPSPISILTLCFAPLKKDRTDFLVEKASELGVHFLQPVFTDHTQSERVNVERLQATAIEAAEQCDRLDAPHILPPINLPNYLQNLSKDSILFLAAESGAAMPIAAAFGHLEPSPNVHFLIGPEGGFSAAEFLMFDKYPAIRRMRLGPRLLRAETAAMAVLSVFQAVTGDWRISSN